MRVVANHAGFVERAQMRFHSFDVLVLVAIKAHRVADLFQQLWHVGLMRVVARGAVFDGIVGELRLGRGEEIIVALPAQRRTGFYHELFIVARVRLVAGHAVAIADWLMHVFLFREVFMTFGAGGFGRLREQALEIRGVRRVAIQAIAGFHGLMLEFVIRQRIVVAIEAKFVAGFDQQIFIRRLMGVVAARTIAVLDGLMLELVARNKILVAGKTELPRGHFWLRRHAAIAVALDALAFRERRVREHYRSSRLGGRRRSRILGLVCGTGGRRFFCGGMLAWHAVKKEPKPLIRGLGVDRRRADKEDQGNQRESRVVFGWIFISHRSGVEKFLESFHVSESINADLVWSDLVDHEDQVLKLEFR
jgi:hypothetical protein